MELSYLQVLSNIAAKLKNNINLEELCGDICVMIIRIMRYPEIAVSRVQIGAILRMSPGFRTTPWGLVREFALEESNPGRLEVYYTAEEKWTGGIPFLNEEEELLDNIAGLLSGAATKAEFRKLLIQNTERLKELGGITRILSILKEFKPIQMLLTDVCNAIPEAWQYPEHTGARITYGDMIFATANFSENRWMQSQTFIVPEGPSGSIDICYTREFPDCDEGPFLKEERNLINNLAQLIATAAGSKLYEQLVNQNRERLKELNAINQTTQIITHGRSIEETLQNVCIILPQSLQYPEFTTARITYGEKEYSSREFKETPWILREQFITIDNQIGTIELFYLTEFPVLDEGPFLKEERNLIKNIGRLLAHFLNNYKGRLLLEYTRSSFIPATADHPRKQLASLESEKNLLFSNNICGTENLYIIREVLFVAAPYEAFVIKNESMVFGSEVDSMHSKNIWCTPRITVVNSSEQGLEYLSQKAFDLVIIMSGPYLQKTIESYTQIVNVFPSLPVYVLINRLEHISPILAVTSSRLTGNNPVFSWNSDPVLLFAIIKLYEDTRNVVYTNDPIVLLIDDDPDMISKIVTRLFRTIMDWVESSYIIGDLNNDTGLHSYPHLLAVSNYESAIHIIRRYKDRICCIVSDIEFDKSGNHDRYAGLEFVEIIKEQCKNASCFLHSSDGSHRKDAIESGCVFMEKSAPELIDVICKFVSCNLQKSILSIHDESGKIIGQASSIYTVLQLIEKMPDETVNKNLHDGELERWFSCHGETSDAHEISCMNKSDDDAKIIKKRLVELLRKMIRRRSGGTTIKFENFNFFDKHLISVLCKGSYGGKGRGVAFLNTIVNGQTKHFEIPGIKICSPITGIIGTGEFELILKSECIKNIDIYNTDYQTIRKCFLNAQLSQNTKKNLLAFVEQVNTPVAVRSSSLFEDSLVQPFAGAFETYIIPNSNENPEKRAEKLEQAVKLVFSSLFRPEAMTYFKLTNRNIKEERMAVVLQELVGTQFGNYYYPHISGVAGSFNYYPVSHMKPEDGFAVIAFGLGVYVVEGRSGHRFSPNYPDIDFGSIKDALNNSQVRFYAVNLDNTDADLLNDGEKACLDLLDIEMAEKTGALKHCASVYDTENDRIITQLNIAGPRIVDFADILKYNYFPLADSLKLFLDTLSEYMGTPVEIEFALKLPHENNNLSEPELYLLQVKPLVGEQLVHEIKNMAMDPETVMLYSETALGNGIMDTIADVIMVDLSKFDRTRTDEITREVEYFNRKFIKEKSAYILIGPGRWGTRDKSLGIPVVWAQISNARVIIELGLENYPLDASLGSHFFHNLTSMCTGYMAINENNSSEVINLDLLSNATLVERLNFVQHFRFPSPLHIEIDGKKKIAIISWRGKK